MSLATRRGLVVLKYLCWFVWQTSSELFVYDMYSWSGVSPLPPPPPTELLWVELVQTCSCKWKQMSSFVNFCHSHILSAPLPRHPSHPSFSVVGFRFIETVRTSWRPRRSTFTFHTPPELWPPPPPPNSTIVCHMAPAPLNLGLVTLKLM